jgi:NADH dehydrogenase FAD-containing subunit
MNPCSRRVILAGGGHAHLYIASQAQAFAERGVELVKFWYSGLATGMLGGQYERDNDTLDPGALIRARGGHAVRDRIVELDRAARHIRLGDGTVLNYDLLSFNIGSEGKLPSGLAGQPDIIPVKPIANLWKLHEALLAKWRQSKSAVKVRVVGGGVTGCEITANLQALARRAGEAIELTLITTTPRLLAQWPRPCARPARY